MMGIGSQQNMELLTTLKEEIRPVDFIELWLNNFIVKLNIKNETLMNKNC